MEKIYKIFVINKEPYLVEDDVVKIGDKAIVTVNDLFPTLVECKNEEQIKLIQEPKTSMTKRYKVKVSTENLDLPNEILIALDNLEGPLLVKYVDDKLIIHSVE